MATEREIGIAIGLLEGEGCISFSRMKNTKGEWSYLRPSVSIANSDSKILQKLLGILLELGVENPRIHYEQDKRYLHRKETTKGYGPNKPCHRLHIANRPGIKSFLSLVVNDLTTKRKQVELMLEFVERRNSVHWRTPYSERDFEIANEVSFLNIGNYSRSVTTARDPLVTEKIQSELHGDVESAAEMTAPARNICSL